MAITLQPNELKVFYDNGWTDYDIQNAIDIKRKQGADDREIRNSVYRKLNQLDKSSVGENIATNFKEIQRAIPTIGGHILQKGREAIEDITTGNWDEVKEGAGTFAKTVGGAVAGGLAGSAVPIIGTVGGAITGGLAGLLGPKELANAVVGTYGQSLDQPFSGEALKYSVKKRPIEVGLDVVTLGGPQIAKGSKSLVNSPFIKENAPLLRGFSDEYKDVSRAITQSKVNAQASLNKPSKVIGDIANLDKNILTEEFYRSLITGDTSKLAMAENYKDLMRARKRVLAVSKKLEDVGIKEGLVDEVNSANQKVATRLKELKGDTITVADALDYVDRYNAGLPLSKDIKKIIKEGYDQVDKKNIAYLTQAVLPAKAGENIVSQLSSKGNIFESPRLIGNTAKALYSRIPNSLEYHNKALQNALGMKQSLYDMVNKYGRKITVDEWKKGVEGKVVSLKYMNEQLAKDFNKIDNLNDNSSDFIKALRTDMGTKSKLANKYKDDLYLVPKEYMDMLGNSYKKDSFELNSIMKKSLITSLKWLVDNRMGNLINNTIEGVTPLDYRDAKLLKQYKPAQIDVTTSYAGQIGDAPNIAIPSKKSIREFKDNMSNVIADRDRTKSLVKAYGNINDIVTSPLSWADSRVERFERYANYIRQAKRYAKENNIDFKDVLKQGKNDSDLFWNLYQNTNKSMGDYLGRNYAISPELQKYIDLIIPFHKFATQTARVTGRQLARNPLPFYSTLGLSTHEGRDLSNEIIEQYNLDPMQYTGGVIVDDTKGDGKYSPYRTMRYGSVPLNAVVSSYLGGVEGLSRSTNPLFSIPILTAMFRNPFGQLATTPNAYVDYSTGRLRDRETGEEYKPTEFDRLKLLSSNLSQTTFAPLVAWNRTIYPLSTGFKNILFGDRPEYPKYDVNAVRGLSYNTDATPAISGYEHILPLLGIQTPKVYQKYTTSQRTRARELRKQIRRQARRNRIYNQERE